MSLTNFVFQAVPIWIVVLIMIAHVMSQTNLKRINILATKSVNILLLIGTICAFYVSSKHTYGKICLASALTGMENKNSEKTHSAFEKGIPFIGEDGNFHEQYGIFLIHERKIKDAKDQFLKALKYSSNPEIFINLAFCNYTENNIIEAEQNLCLAKYMVPSHFNARYALLQLYNTTNQWNKAIVLSEEILTLPFKENNDDALKARQLAMSILNTQTP